MLLKNTACFRTAGLLSLWLFCIAAYAQNENLIEPTNQPDSLIRFNSFKISPVFQTDSHSDLDRIRLPNSFKDNLQFNKNYYENRLSGLSFKQNKSESILNGLGSYQHFNNQFTFGKNKLNVEIESGLVSQNTLLMSTPIYQISLGTLIKYSVTDWLDAYLYGQYVTKPINRPDDFFDPFLYSNPLFIQTELGGGLRTNFEKVNADLKIFSIYRKESKTLSPMNSVIRIKF